MVELMYFTSTSFIISYHELDVFIAAEFGLIISIVIFSHEQLWKS